MRSDCRGGKKIRICILLNTSIVTTRVQPTLFLFWIILKPSICLLLSTFGCLWWACYDSNASYPFISRHLYGSLLQRLCDSSRKVLWQTRSKGMVNSWTLGLALWKWDNGHERKKKTSCLCLLEDENQNDKRVSLFMKFIPHLTHQPDRTV